MTGGSLKQLTEETYIRQLPYSVVKHISLLLDVDRQWERFVLQIPRRLQDVGQDTTDMRYSNLQVRLFEDKGKRPDGSPTKTIMGEAKFCCCSYSNNFGQFFNNFYSQRRNRSTSGKYNVFILFSFPQFRVFFRLRGSSLAFKFWGKISGKMPKGE